MCVNENEMIIEENRFDKERLQKYGSLFCLSNGYMGLRGALEETYAEDARGLFICGTYDSFDGKEAAELPNCADVAGIEILIDGERFAMDRGTVLHYRRFLDIKGA